MNLQDFTREEPGGGRDDLTLLLADASAFGEVIARMEGFGGMRG